MSSKDFILEKYRRNVANNCEMPRLDDIAALTYSDPIIQFIDITQANGSRLVEVKPDDDLNRVITDCYPEAKTIASALPEITIANRNPDKVKYARELDGTDVGVVRAQLGVAENGCMWIPQQCKEKAVQFISENLVVILPRTAIVNNMHEAYRRIEFGAYNFGTFIAGPSKTADIAQVLVLGAQAARSCTVLLVNE